MKKKEISDPRNSRHCDHGSEVTSSSGKEEEEGKKNETEREKNKLKEKTNGTK